MLTTLKWKGFREGEVYAWHSTVLGSYVISDLDNFMLFLMSKCKKWSGLWSTDAYEAYNQLLEDLMAAQFPSGIGAKEPEFANITIFCEETRYMGLFYRYRYRFQLELGTYRA